MLLRILLVDASVYLYRFFHRKNSKNVIEEFYILLKSIRGRRAYDLYFIAFDSPLRGYNYRTQLCADYKGNRPASPICSSTRHFVYLLTHAMGFNGIQITGWEADDIIAYLVLHYKEHVYAIWSSDKDLYQLLHYGDITMQNRGRNITKDNIRDYYPVGSSQVVEYLSLLGDTSDNIKGVPKVGQVMASKLLNEYSSIENILTNVNALPLRIKNSLLESQSLIERNKKIIDLTYHYQKSHDKFYISLQDGNLHDVDTHLVRDLLTEYNMLQEVQT